MAREWCQKSTGGDLVSLADSGEADFVRFLVHLTFVKSGYALSYCLMILICELHCEQGEKIVSQVTNMMSSNHYEAAYWIGLRQV